MTTRFLVFGNFGFRKNQLDGQTIKTRTLAHSLKTLPDTHVDILDAGTYRLASVILILPKLLRMDHVVFLPGIKQLVVIAPLLLTLKYLLGFKVHYVVVGGWITGKLGNPYINLLIRFFDSISCELESMRQILILYNKNTYILENYRDDQEEIIAVPKQKDTLPLRLVYFSRVMTEKGIFEALELTEQAAARYKGTTLDIYGQLCFKQKEDAQRFEDILRTLPDLFTYHGGINPEDITHVLSAYDVLLFPTYYEGEGFPGCIVDAMRSSLCVICTDWKYNAEIMEKSNCGYVVADSFVENALPLIENLQNDRKLLEQKKRDSRAGAVRYGKAAFETWRELVF